MSVKVLQETEAPWNLTYPQRHEGSLFPSASLDFPEGNQDEQRRSVHMLKALGLGDVEWNRGLAFCGWVYGRNSVIQPSPGLEIRLVLVKPCIWKGWKPREEKQSFWQMSNFVLPVLTVSLNNSRRFKQVSVEGCSQSDSSRQTPEI